MVPALRLRHEMLFQKRTEEAASSAVVNTQPEWSRFLSRSPHM